jgi:hypothetical protein
MKVRCEVDLDTDTGEYSVRFWNMSSPGSDIEYNEVRVLLQDIFTDIDENIMNAEDEDNRVLKVIH